jgi:hypothetical protein
VAEACLLGESGSAQHLAAWITHHEDDSEDLLEAPRAALRLLLRLEKK